MEALQLQPNAVVEVTDRAAFVALESEWDALNARTANLPFTRHGFLRIWIDNFAPKARLRILTLRDAAGRLTAALPLMEERAYLYGVPVRQLVATANAHSCRFELLAEDPEAAGAAFFAHLAQDKSWDLLRLVEVPDGAAAYHLFEEAKRAQFPTGTYETISSPYVPLPQSWDELAAKLQSKFKANVRRRRKKLEEKGKVTFERFGNGQELEARLDEGYALEASGWKGARGTAIALDAATRGFYSELGRTSAYDGSLALYYLRVDGRAVAFQYGLTFDGRYFFLKPGYDESLRECSPGQLLMEEVLKDCVGQGLREFDFLGPNMTWKQDWTDQVRVHNWLYVFRNDRLGRALCKAKFKWVPAAREVMAQWKK